MIRILLDNLKNYITYSPHGCHPDTGATKVVLDSIKKDLEHLSKKDDEFLDGPDGHIYYYSPHVESQLKNKEDLLKKHIGDLVALQAILICINEKKVKIRELTEKGTDTASLKKIEENNLLDKVNLKKPDCEFTYLLNLANENKDEKLAELIFGNILTSISESNIRDLLFYEIPQNIKGSVFVYLIKEINKITLIEKSCNVLLSGKIYEYFIGRDESAISELLIYYFIILLKIYLIK